MDSLNQLMELIPPIEARHMHLSDSYERGPPHARHAARRVLHGTADGHDGLV